MVGVEQTLVVAASSTAAAAAIVADADVLLCCTSVSNFCWQSQWIMLSMCVLVYTLWPISDMNSLEYHTAIDNCVIII